MNFFPPKNGEFWPLLYNTLINCIFFQMLEQYGPPDFAALVILRIILSSDQFKLTRGMIKFSLLVCENILDVLRLLVKHKIFR